MATVTEPASGKVRQLTATEARKLFEREARRRLNMSTKQFLAAWDARKFEDPEDPDVAYMAMLIPLIR